jgi:hypothetical protein
MSDTTASTMAAAAQSLRDAAKWLVGGVVATAAGVFAGTSLTAFGSLDPFANTLRMLIALGGLLAGFAGLAFIFASAIGVLNRHSITFREIATAGQADKTLINVRRRLLERYRHLLPPGAQTFADYVRQVDEALSKSSPSDDERELISRAREHNAIIGSDASFLMVESRFQNLVKTIWIATPLAILGFGMFAWAANPAKPVAPSVACPPAVQTPTR